MRVRDRYWPAAGLVAILWSGGLLAMGADADAGAQPAANTSLAEDGSRVQLSTNALEVLRLAEAGVEAEVITAYIENSPSPFALTADAIVYLKDLGIESPIVAAMVRHDTVLKDQQFQTGITNQATAAVPTPQAVTNTPATTAATPVYVTNAPPDVTYFYSTLEPYGSWVVLDGLGWCWQPHVMIVNRYWRPYWHSGRWLYTDCGWYWQSDYSWGWATFHHGRWHHHHRHGWVWFPDRVWAPAWVTWRYSDTHCGWAPLPPGAHFVIGHGFRFNHVSVGINFDFGLAPELFSFLEIRHLHERHPHLHAIPAPRAREVYHQTTVNNNFVAGSNNRIVNQGIAVERVSRASRTPIQQVTIRDAPATPGRSTPPDRIERDGSARVLYRPQLRSPATPTAPVAQQIDDRHPVVTPTVRRAPTVSQSAPRTQPRVTQPAPSSQAAPPAGPTVRPTPPSKPSTTPPVRREESPAAPPSQRTQPPSQRTPPPSQPAQPPSRQPRPSVVPRTVPSPPSESPRGRDQRLSNGQSMRPPKSLPPASRRSTEPSPRSPHDNQPRK